MAFSVLTYHYGLTPDQIKRLSIVQFIAYLDNLGFILNPKQEQKDSLDASKPEDRAFFEQALGVKRA